MSHEPEMADNPYAPVAAEPPQVAPLSEAAAIRQKHLSHEASIKSIGILYLLGACILIPVGLWVMAATSLGLGGGTITAESFITPLLVGFLQIAFGVLQAATGLALRQFKNWARVVAIIFSVIGLIGFPLGTLISAYFLYLLVSPKGVYIFSDEYQQVIAATPDMRYKTSIIVWIFLILLLVLIVFGIVRGIVGVGLR